MNERISHLSIEDLQDFVERQLEAWPMAKRNFDAFSSIERRCLEVDGLEMAVQFNPARAVSTMAAVKDGIVADRPCFLCEKNRPPEQKAIELIPGWKLLLNPFPIFPLHFTIVADSHRPQERVPEDIVKWAEILPGMAVFFNGAKAGASAPDHLHMQAVLKDELPLLRKVEELHPSDQAGIRHSSEFGVPLPFDFFSGVIDKGRGGLTTMMAGLALGSKNEKGRFADSALVNTFFWLDPSGAMRFLSIPRRAHRPDCYFEEGEKQLLVSPGAIDMAGIIITPRKEDFDKISPDDIKKIYSEVAFHD